MQLKIGGHYRITENGLNYVVCGADPYGRFWLVVENGKTYDGYDGDLIVGPGPRGVLAVRMCDERSSVRGAVTIIPIEESPLEASQS